MRTGSSSSRAQQELFSHDRKKPFSFPIAFRRLERAIRPYRQAALFELYDKGFTSLFEQLVACLISIRTFDEQTVPCAERLFAKARTPEELARLSPGEIDAAIAPCTFHRAKAETLQALGREIVDQYHGELPAEREALLALKGVGPKCAALALGIAGKEPALAVDIHVHRIANRWGVVRTKAPERTMAELQEIIPRRYWIDTNRLLVPFGKHVCTGQRPWCSRCPVEDMCRQVGVRNPR